MAQEAQFEPNSTHPTIAILCWGNVIEDYLKDLDLSLDELCEEMTGGWLFGYIEALKHTEIRSVLIFTSDRVEIPTRYRHRPSGSTIWALPSPPPYKMIRRHMMNPYGFTIQETFGKSSSNQLHRSWLGVLRDIAPYLATPVRSLMRVLKKENCQTILCQEYEYARFDICTWIGKRMKIPVYASFQGGDFQISRLEKWLRPASIRRCTGLIAAPQSEVSRLKRVYGIPSEKIARIFNPLDLNIWANGNSQTVRQQLGIKGSAQVVIWHGRIDIHRKGLDVLLAAWCQVCSQRPDRDIHLLLVGTGRDASKLGQHIKALQPKNLHWINQYILDRNLIRNYLYAADFYTLPSRHEGFAVAPLEAMACRLPVVATDAPGMVDILEGQAASGGLIIPKDSASELAAAIGQLLDDSELRQMLSQRAYQRVQAAFSTEAVGQQLRDFLQLSKAAK